MQGRLFKAQVDHSPSELGRFVGATVVSVCEYRGTRLVQLEYQWLSELCRETLVYVLRELGIVNDADLRGGMGWNFRIRKAKKGLSLVAPQAGGHAELPVAPDAADAGKARADVGLGELPDETEAVGESQPKGPQAEPAADKTPNKATKPVSATSPSTAGKKPQRVKGRGFSIAVPEGWDIVPKGKLDGRDFALVRGDLGDKDLYGAECDTILWTNSMMEDGFLCGEIVSVAGTQAMADALYTAACWPDLGDYGGLASVAGDFVSQEVVQGQNCTVWVLKKGAASPTRRTFWANPWAGPR